MATICSTTYPEGGLMQAFWDGLANGQAGDAASIARASDKTVQVLGTFGASGSVTIQGSNDGSTWATLTDPQGNALTFTSAGISAIAENPRYIRPNCTAGDGSTDLDIYILGRSPE